MTEEVKRQNLDTVQTLPHSAKAPVTRRWVSDCLPQGVRCRCQYRLPASRPIDSLFGRRGAKAGALADSAPDASRPPNRPSPLDESSDVGG